MLKIVYTKWNLANRFDDHIELNEALIKNPKLRKQILKHENAHSDEKFTFKDIKIDLANNDGINQRDLIKFMIKHPKTLTQMFPVYWSGYHRKVIYDINLLIIYGVFIVLISGGLFAGFKFL